MKFLLENSQTDDLQLEENDITDVLSIDGVKSPEDLMDWMNENITYELVDDAYSNSNGVPTKTAEEVLKTGTGHCAEQSYLEKEVLDNLGYETFLVMVKENNSKKEYGAEGSAHVFLVYKEGKNYCWFEHSMQHARGIHKYTSLEALLQDAANLWWRYDENSDILEVRMMDKVITGVDNWGLAKECYKLPVEHTFDISNNIMESDVPLEEAFTQANNIEAMDKAIQEHFGQDEPGEGCIFIHPSGKFINIYPKLDDHEGLAYWLQEQCFENVIEDAEWFVEVFSYVRCRNSLSQCYVELPLNNITRYQLYSLEEWLETKVGTPTLDIEAPNGEWKNYDLNDYFPEDIIKIIKRYYAAGRLYENYDPPYNAQQVRDNYGEETYQRLIKDPAHLWRMRTGIELIHKEPSKKELERIWANWQLMSDSQKRISDEKSMEFFGKTNEENYNELIKLYESVGKEPELYCISQKDLDGQTLEPRVPDNFFTKNGYEDGETPRVCFAPTIDQCLMAISQKCEGIEFYVFTPDNVPKENIYKPTVKEVPDSKITGEIWVTCPVKLKKVGKIKVLGDSGLDGHPFNYGDKTAELYDWDWEWENKIEESFHSVSSAISKEVQKYDDNGSNQNCMLCTWATELQSRGIDFLPRPVYSPRDIIFTLNGYDIVKDPVKQSIENKEDVISKVTDAGDGARFYCHGNWAGSNGGHEFILANTAGKIMIVDSQSNYVNDITSDSEYFEDINYENSFIVRLDNKEINDDILAYNDEKYIIEWDDTIDAKLLESLSTKISRRDNPNDFSPFGYKVDFYDGDTHIGEGSVCGVKDDNAFLYDFEVYPEYRGKGYSKEMLQFMIDKYDLKQLYVHQDNTVAVNLYKKFGFKVEGEVEDSGKPAYDMIRESYKMRFTLTEGKNLEQTVQQYIDKYRKIVPSATDDMHRAQVIGIIQIDPTYKDCF